MNSAAGRSTGCLAARSPSYAVDRLAGRRSKWGLRLYTAHLAAFKPPPAWSTMPAPIRSILSDYTVCVSGNQLATLQDQSCGGNPGQCKCLKP